MMHRINYEQILGEVLEDENYAGHIMGVNVLLDLQSKEYLIKDDDGKEMLRVDATSQEAMPTLLEFLKHLHENPVLH
jgi:hypothetical protein